MKSGSAPGVVRHARLLVDAFGYWPTFHDAEVHRVEFDRTGPAGRPCATFVIHVFDQADEVDKDGYLHRRVSVLVRLRFEDVEDLRLEDFGIQNVIDSLVIQPEESRHTVAFQATYGIDCTFTCAVMEVLDVRPHQ
jgi:hypothetical protein